MERFSVISFFLQSDCTTFNTVIINCIKYKIHHGMGTMQILANEAEVQYVKQHLKDLQQREIASGDSREFICHGQNGVLRIKWMWDQEEDGSLISINYGNPYINQLVQDHLFFLWGKYQNILVDQVPTMVVGQEDLLALPYYDPTCMVCFDQQVIPSVTSCGHVFCSQCINTWVQIKRECPACKSQI